MWNSNNNNNFHRHPEQQQQQQAQAAQQQQALRRRLSLELAAAAQFGGNVNGNHQGGLGPGAAVGFHGGVAPEHQVALAMAARQQAAVEAALQEERNTHVALATAAARQQAVQQQQQLELMALHRQQHAQAQQAQAAAIAAQELQRRSMTTSPAAENSAAAAAAKAVAEAVASEFEEQSLPIQKTTTSKESTSMPMKTQDDIIPKSKLIKPKESVAMKVEETKKDAPSPSNTPGDPDDVLPPLKPKPKPQAVQPRGKPEAMAKKLASAVRRQEIMEELEAEKEQERKTNENSLKMESLGTHSSGVMGEAITASGVSKKAKTNGSASKKRKKSEDSTGKSAPLSPASKKKKTTPKKKAPAKKSGGGRKSNEGGKSKGSGSSMTFSLMIGNSKVPVPTMDDAVNQITEIEYGRLESLMEQFCRVPLLAEFSRPVSLLHPELINAYTKIIEHPVDLGKVCRRIRRRQYESLRDVRLDAWRIFANCFKYHSHPSNKDAVPSFVSIALHLRDYFNDLWQEHMLTSDYPNPAPTGTGRSKPHDPNAVLRAFMDQRAECRKKRLVVSGLSVMAGKCLERAADTLRDIIKNGGLVDALDTKPIWGEGVTMDEDDEGDMAVVIENFRKLETSIREIIASNEELGVDELESSIKKCYTEGPGLENMSATLRIRIASRMDRYLGQFVVPIHEATCRGVSQSSIWGCMAAAVWARESSKKPYWPALVLGIIAPEDQKEDWHGFLTERNESRLPEKLKSQLLTGKRKAEQAVKKQSLGQADPQSFFLVEFMGSHEFIWVREADIVESFNPEDDPNKKDTPGSRSKKVSRKHLANILGSKMYASAIEEAQWALEEFELQLQDIGSTEEGEDEHEEEGYSYSVLCQSDDEADGETDDEDFNCESLDQDECNELLATNGLLDFSVAGRKRRAAILKQQKLNAEKKQKTVKAKKARADKAKKAKDEKLKEKEKRQEKRDLEKKRRKRMREREKALKNVQHQNKKRKLSDPAPGRRHAIVSKRERAEAIVAGYVSRAAEKGDYKPLGLNGEQRWIQSALIDSTNLCGMALAFRAAAGLIPMPKQDTGAPGKIVLKPWDKIRIKGKKTSVERTALLHQQIELLEKEIKLRKASKARRLERLKEVEFDVTKLTASVLEDDKLARENPLKKSKKPHPLAGKKRKRPGDDKLEAKAEPKKSNSPTPVSAKSTTLPDESIQEAKPEEDTIVSEKAAVETIKKETTEEDIEENKVETPTDVTEKDSATIVAESTEKNTEDVSDIKEESAEKTIEKDSAEIKEEPTETSVVA